MSETGDVVVPEDSTADEKMTVIERENQIIIQPRIVVPKIESPEIRVPVEFKPEVRVEYRVSDRRRDIILAVIAAALVAGLFF